MAAQNLTERVEVLEVKVAALEGLPERVSAVPAHGGAGGSPSRLRLGQRENHERLGSFIHRYDHAWASVPTLRVLICVSEWRVPARSWV
jgi:hypothetical protein